MRSHLARLNRYDAFSYLFFLAGWVVLAANHRILDAEGWDRFVSWRFGLVIVATILFSYGGKNALLAEMMRSDTTCDMIRQRRIDKRRKSRRKRDEA
jgi:hypothetical protein